MITIYREEYIETQKDIQQKIIQATELINSSVKPEPQAAEANTANHGTAVSQTCSACLFTDGPCHCLLNKGLLSA